ncbi:MAG: insulinase family protein [Muribaculaceae bacterium]|nr:insulinase family protein [Muribaculaceae bacterium]
MNYVTHTLANGLRVALCRTDAKVAYIGVVIGSGSRDEEPDRYGLAHFVEHTIFKGTWKRSSSAISSRMESIGGELNASTSKENTIIYTSAPAGYADRAIELLADIIANSLFPEHEVAMEHEVVVEEIKSYLDSPSENVYDEYEERIFKHSALAHNILGTPESVRALTGRECRRFLDLNYTPGNMVVYISSPDDPEKLIKRVEKHFGLLNFPFKRHERELPAPVIPFDEVIDNNGFQAHTIYGTRTVSRDDPRRFPLYLLNNYIGGPCMSSRLNSELREKRGLVYAVDSFNSLFSDTGLWSVYIGCDKSNVKKCLSIVRKELDRLAQTTMSDRMLDKIKTQFCGQLLVSTDNRENMAINMGKSLLFRDAIYDTSHTAERIRAVTAEQLREVAELLAPAGCSRLTLL